jgi:phospholipid/cholesterol/gamma-HCH transport system permease protein
MVLDLGYLATHPARTPWREISATIYEAGVRALVVTAVVGFLTGMVASYLGVLSLKQFGAQTLIVNILGITTVRELGPVLTGILVAARSGSAFAAQLGVMRVTQELDALSAMGTSQSLRLVLPKVIGLAIAVPLLVMWTDTVSLLGAMLIAGHTLDIGLLHLLAGLPDVVPLTNFWFGIVKGAVFGIAVALIAADYGLRTEPDTESLGRETTNSVVMTITVVILLDAALAVAFQNVGFQ